MKQFRDHNLQGLNALKAPFTLTALPYPQDHLAPVLSPEIMNFHHDKHHQAYVDKLNEAIEKNHATLLEIFRSATTQTDEVKNNAGGHWNHSFFWTVLGSRSESTMIPEEFKEELIKEFGTVEQFTHAFEECGNKVFGSGWVWLILNDNGFIEITTTTNQNNPLMNSEKHQGIPILAFDVWEHAYYLKYKNDRATYLKDLWEIINWNQVSAYWQEAKSLKL